jgi:O-antigen/teichoic acid export membrane protein
MGEAKSIFRSVLALLSSRFAGSFLTVGFTIFFAHKLSKTEFAAIAVFEVLTSVTNMISNFGLETYCIRKVPSLLSRGDINVVSGMIKTAFLNRLLWSVGIALTMIVFSERVAILLFHDASYANAVRIIASGAALASMNTSMTLIAQCIKAFREIAIINFSIAFAICALSSVLYYTTGYEGWVIGYTLGRLIGFLSLAFILRKWIFSRSDLFHWYRMVKISFPYYLRGFAKFGRLRLDQLVITILMGPATLASYYIAKKCPQYIDLIIEAVARPVLIRIAESRERSKCDIVGLFSRISRYNSFLFIPLCLAVPSFGLVILELFGGRKYDDALVILVILCLSRLVNGLMYTVYEAGVFIMCRPRHSLLIDIAGALSNTGGLLILLPLLDSTGVALATLLSTIIAQFTARYLLNSKISVRFDIAAARMTTIAMIGFIGVALFAQLTYYSLSLIPLYFAGASFVFLLIFCPRLESQDLELISTVFPRSGEYVLRFVKLFPHGVRVNIQQNK